jgi:hypothetical protein
MGGKRDTFGTRDGLQASISVPEGEEHLVEGLTEDEESTPTEPRPANLAVEVRETKKGWGLFVSTQEAPLTVNNATWYASKDAAEAGLKHLHDNFGWVWTSPVYHREEREVENPNTGEVEKRVVKTGEVARPGFWSHSYGLVLDSSSLQELLP